MQPGAGDPIAIVTLGCPKNLVDSEVMLGSLRRSGFRIAERLEEAALVIVNTCAFLTASQQESVEMILEVARLKETGRLEKLVVAGCLPQRHGASVLEEIPEVDYLLGPGTVGQAVEVARGLLEGRLGRGSRLSGLDRIEVEWEPRVVSGRAHSAYLKISEGCDHTCAFCIIPKLRGRHRSRPIEDIEAEARWLASSGIRELTLVAQDTTAWGRELPGSPRLETLLARLDGIEGIRWIRLLYTYPRGWTDGLIESFGRLCRLVPYVDIPIQHTADSVLRRMRRGPDWTRTEKLLGRIRDAAPGMALRTTVITGFPGETEEEFNFLLRSVRDFEFDHLGAFAYSTEEGTPAADLGGTVPEDVREERRSRIMAEQRAISLRRNRARIGETLEVLIDEVEPDRRIARGRWQGQAPEIDGTVIVSLPPGAISGDAGGLEPRPGDFVFVRIRGAGPYDLVGVPVDSRTEEFAGGLERMVAVTDPGARERSVLGGDEVAPAEQCAPAPPAGRGRRGLSSGGACR